MLHGTDFGSSNTERSVRFQVGIILEKERLQDRGHRNSAVSKQGFPWNCRFARDEEVLCEHVESLCSSSIANMAPSTSGQCAESTLKSDVNRKRKRHRSWDGLAKSESPAKRGVTKGMYN